MWRSYLSSALATLLIYIELAGRWIFTKVLNLDPSVAAGSAAEWCNLGRSPSVHLSTPPPSTPGRHQPRSMVKFLISQAVPAAASSNSLMMMSAGCCKTTGVQLRPIPVVVDCRGKAGSGQTD